ncbi:putative aminohydrolase [Mycena polygramma]|nr:putative aminohydrolase [Mycena polygramma]
MAPKFKFDLVILNGVVVTASDTSSLDIGIKDGKIHTLAASFTTEEIGDAHVVDAEGGMVMPGGIDAHVHLCQDKKTTLGLTIENADNFETGSRSAVCGGTTTMITFAAQSRREEDRSLLKVVEAYSARAEATGSYIDYAFHVIIARDDPDVLETEMPVLVEKWGITSCKLFMTYEAMRLQDYQLLDVMLAALKNSITTMIHAENGDMIQWLTDKLESKDMMAPYYHALSRPPSVEGEAANRAIVLAELIESPILFVHVGSSSSADVIRAAQTRGLPIFAETCPQYLTLTWEDLKRFHSPTCFENSKMVCSPPPGPDSSDQNALYVGLHNGTFTIFSSDHAPYQYDHPHGKMAGLLAHEPHGFREDHNISLAELAQKKTGAFKLIPNGIPGVETRLPLLFTRGVATGRITAQKFVELTATNPAKLYGLYPRKGAILPGSDADIVIWHLEGSFPPFKLTNQNLHHNVDYTPYEGMEFDNWPRYTILRGKVVWANGVLLGKPRDGEYLKRGPSQLGKGVAHFKKDPRRVAAWLHQ